VGGNQPREGKDKPSGFGGRRSNKKRTQAKFGRGRKRKRVGERELVTSRSREIKIKKKGIVC